MAMHSESLNEWVCARERNDRNNYEVKLAAKEMLCEESNVEKWKLWHQSNWCDDDNIHYIQDI